jgi:hypothetical protein
MTILLKVLALLPVPCAVCRVPAFERNNRQQQAKEEVQYQIIMHSLQ